MRTGLARAALKWAALFFCALFSLEIYFQAVRGGNYQRPFEWTALSPTAGKGFMKKRIVSLLLTLLTVLSLLPTAALAAESTGVGITPVTDPNLWTIRLNSNGQSYSYRPPTA